MNASEFYLPLLRTFPATNCRMRFFYYFNVNSSLSVSGTKLEVFIRYADKSERESAPIRSISLSSTSDDVTQRWIKSTADFVSIRPFQFVFRAYLSTTQSRIALDDITFDPNCVSVARLSQSTTTTVSSPVITEPTSFSSSTPSDSLIGNQPKKTSSGTLVLYQFSQTNYLIFV